MVRSGVSRVGDRVGGGYGSHARMGRYGTLGAARHHGAGTHQLCAHRNSGPVYQGDDHFSARLMLTRIACVRSCFCIHLVLGRGYNFSLTEKVCVLLYIGLLLYDTFWVFFSAQVFSSNVMIDVASKQSVNPIAVSFAAPTVPSAISSNRSLSASGTK